MDYAVENARFQWLDGERRVGNAPEPARAALERAVDALVAELRRRLGGAFELEELARLYGSGADWAHDLAERRMAGGDTAAVVDAAFALYAREAADYAGGRQVEHRVRRD